MKHLIKHTAPQAIDESNSTLPANLHPEYVSTLFVTRGRVGFFGSVITGTCLYVSKGQRGVFGGGTNYEEIVSTFVSHVSLPTYALPPQTCRQTISVFSQDDGGFQSTDADNRPLDEIYYMVCRVFFFFSSF